MSRKKRKKRGYYSEYPEDPYRWWDEEYQHDYRGLMGIYDSYRRPTPAQQQPYEPRRIKHVVFDADDTIWDIEPFGLASMCKPPVKEIQKDNFDVKCRKFIVTKDEEGKVVGGEEVLANGVLRLRPGIVETIDKLRSKGIGTSIASNNEPNSVENLITAIGLRDKFDVIISDWESKGTMVRKISREVDARPKEMIFVDDSPLNVYDIDKLGAISLCIDRDIISPEEILQFIKETE